MSKDRPILDAKWLLGEEPKSTNKNGWQWPATVATLLTLIVVVWSWPMASRWWMQRELHGQLKRANTADKAIGPLIGLGEFLPDSLPDVVECLRLSDPSAHRLAYQILDRYLDGLLLNSDLRRQAQVQQFVAAIDKSYESLELEALSLAKELASKVLKAQEQDESSSSQAIVASCKTIVDHATAKSLEFRQVQSPDQQVALANDSERVTLASNARRVSDQPLGQSVRSGTKLPENSLRSLDEASESSPRVFSSPTVSTGTSVRASSLNSPYAIPIYTVKPSTGIDDQEKHPTGSEFANSSYLRTVGSDDPESRTNPPMSMPNGVVSLRRPVSSDMSTTGTVTDEGDDVKATLATIHLRSHADLVRLLGNQHTSISQAAFTELIQQGWKDAELSLAIELAKGNSQRCLELMDQIVKSENLNPIPWLTWMAEDGDRPVRRQAIALLGSMNDETARRALRQLLQRERDSEINNQIQHFLTASALNNKSLRR